MITQAFGLPLRKDPHIQFLYHPALPSWGILPELQWWWLLPVLVLHVVLGTTGLMGHYGGLGGPKLDLRGARWTSPSYYPRPPQCFLGSTHSTQMPQSAEVLVQSEQPFQMKRR